MASPLLTFPVTPGLPLQMGTKVLAPLANPVWSVSGEIRDKKDVSAKK